MTKSILILILLINIAYSSICNYTIDYKNKEFNEVRKTIDKLFKENNLVVVKEIVNKRFHQKSKYKAYYASILYAYLSTQIIYKFLP